MNFLVIMLRGDDGNIFFSGAQFAFSIYDFEGKEEVDAFYLGDVLRALNLNPTLEMIEKLGGQKIKSKFY